MSPAGDDSPDQQPVLEFGDIRKTYRSSGGVETKALRGVGLKVAKGEFVAVMGASGSGKSTLMNIVGLLDRQFEGSYRLDGVEVSGIGDQKAAEIRNQQIGFVFQQFNLLRRATVLQNVLLPTTYGGKFDATARALDVIEGVGLAPQVSQRSNQLSGGQMQRVAIARALVMNPSLILADEPTGNLDSTTAADVMDLFNQVHEQGNTVILITHESEIAAHADRVVHLRDGNVVEVAA
jgi:putative ABC transport system ATP-binding protein